MSRAVWKGPFVEESLMKKVDKYKADSKKIPIKTWCQLLHQETDEAANEIAIEEAKSKVLP